MALIADLSNGSQCRVDEGLAPVSKDFSSPPSVRVIILGGPHLYIGSAPRLAEDVACLVPVFPPGTRAKALLGRPVTPKLTGRLLF